MGMSASLKTYSALLYDWLLRKPAEAIPSGFADPVTQDKCVS